MKLKSKRRVFQGAVLFLLGLILLLATAAYASAGRSLRCLTPSSGPARAGIASRVLISGGRPRCYLLYVPPGYDPARASPVVLALHGFAGNAAGLRSIAVWEPVADREGFLVVYPDGSSFPQRWNIGPRANIPSVDDVQFIRDVIGDLSEIAAIDQARIYVTGFSNGGQMVHRIACQLADEVAAVGIVDGFDAGMLDECAPPRPIPVMAFFGTANPLAGATYPAWFLRLMNVSTDPEPPLPADAIELWLEGWAERNGCLLEPEPLPASGNASGVHYGGCRNEADVVLVWVEGQGHAWPGGPALPFLGDSVSDVNASESLWAFFREHPRASPPQPAGGEGS